MIITETGNYKTRNGLSVRVFDVQKNSPYTFAVKGNILIPRKSGRGFRTSFNTWQKNGQNVAVGETVFDIVERI